MNRKTKVFALTIVLAYLVACVSLTPSQRAVAVFQDVNTVYEEVLIGAGQAHAAGKLSDEQLEEIRAAGQKVEIALKASKVTLDAIISNSGGGTETRLEIELDLLVRYLDDLKALWEAFKHVS